MKTKNILIVDDNQDARELLQNILETKNYKVFTATNGYEVIKYVTSKKVDLIILDIMMPQINGYQVAHTLKQNKTTARIPIIFLSAKSGSLDQKYAQKLGAAAYFTKPFCTNTLLNNIKEKTK